MSAVVGLTGIFDSTHAFVMVAICATHTLVLLVLRRRVEPVSATKAEATSVGVLIASYACFRLFKLATAPQPVLDFARAAAADLSKAGSTVTMSRVLVGFYLGTMPLRPVALVLLHFLLASPPLIAWAVSGDTSWLRIVAELIVIPSFGGSCVGQLLQRVLLPVGHCPPLTPPHSPASGPPSGSATPTARRTAGSSSGSSFETAESGPAADPPTGNAKLAGEAGLLAGKMWMDALAHGVICAVHSSQWYLGHGSGHAVGAMAFVILAGFRVGLQAAELPEARKSSLSAGATRGVMFGIPTTFLLLKCEIIVYSELEMAFYVFMFGAHVCLMSLCGDPRPNRSVVTCRVPSPASGDPDVPQCHHLRLHVGIAQLLAVPFFRPPPGTEAATLWVLLVCSTVVGQFLSAATTSWFLAAVSTAARHRKPKGDSRAPPTLQRAHALRRMCEQVRLGTAQLVDVREEYEHGKHGAIAKAVLYPLSCITRGEEPPAPFVFDRLTYLYCSRGIRVHSAVELLASLQEDKLLVPLSEGFDTLVKFGRSDGGIAAEVLAPTNPATTIVPSSEDIRNRVLREALQTSRDYAAYGEVGVLGRGSFGTVVLLQDPSGMRKVVAKCINVDADLDDASLKKMEEEVKMLQRLRHRHVIGYLGTFFTSGRMHILMEYAPGGTLKQQIAAARKLATPLKGARVCRWARQLVLGLQSIHCHGVIHRDLKPDNLLLGAEDDIKIADFGWSTTLAPTRLATTFAGTPYYMAPEVLRREQDGYGMPADLWSVGCLLFEMLALQRPFRAGSLEELEAVVGSQIVQLKPHLSASAHPVEVCLLATSGFLLHPDTAKRMTLTELISALERVPVPSDPGPPATREADPSAPAASGKAHDARPPDEGAPRLRPVGREKRVL